MTSVPVAEAKARLSALIKSGQEIIITNGQNREAVAVIVPFAEWQKTRKRVPGILAGYGPLKFVDDWKLTDEELLQS